MRYGSIEYQYAEPFAESLAHAPEFRQWVLSKTKFRGHPTARLLNQEMAARRSSVSTTWWRSHFTEKCRCSGCSGQETDLLAIFEAPTGERFALHVEIKQPSDRFPTHKDQAANYAVRAECWSKSAPAAVLPHSDATTMLVYSKAKQVEYAPHIAKFGASITFEELREQFPNATYAS